MRTIITCSFTHIFTFDETDPLDTLEKEAVVELFKRPSATPLQKIEAESLSSIIQMNRRLLKPKYFLSRITGDGISEVDRCKM